MDKVNKTDKLIRFKDLKILLGIDISRSTMFRWERDGKFPKHINMGANTIAWFLSDVEKWMNDKRKPNER